MGSQAATVMEASTGQEAEVIAISMMILAQVYTEKGNPIEVYRPRKAEQGQRTGGCGKIHEAEGKYYRISISLWEPCLGLAFLNSL